MGRHAALGVFDSGLGGLTVVHALRRRLPRESILYLGDTARVPYGSRSPDTVIRYAQGCARLLTKRGVKALVIACNTVSAVAIDMLRAELDLPVVGVVEPGARAALRIVERLSRSRDPRALRIGVLGTVSTISSGAYPRAVGTLSTRVEVIVQPAPLLVPLVEEGWLEGDVPRLAIERYVRPLVEADVGVIVLGCTHYPLLKELITDVACKMAGREIFIVDSAEATADAVEELLGARELSTPVSDPENALELLVTDLPATFRTVANRFLQEEKALDVHQVDL